jgi:hypothetical protein
MKKMLALCCLTASFSAGAASALGVPNCADWGDKSVQYVTHSWLLGYMTALNIVWTREGEPDMLKGTTSAQLVLWMDDYCKAHLLSDAVDGSVDLVRELRAKNKQGR